VTVEDRIRWDQRYRSRTTPYPAPEPLLFQYTPPSTPDRPSRAADLACGVGQNGLWLAEQGYTVDLIDISREALVIAQREAARRSLRSLNFLQTDLDDTALQTEAYDLVCVFRFLQRDLIERIRASVRPGGRVIYATYTLGWLRHQPNAPPQYLLAPGELGGFFADWRGLHQRETDHMAEIAAVKPGPR